MTLKMTWVENHALNVLARYVRKQQRADRMARFEAELGSLEAINMEVRARIAKTDEAIAALRTAR